MFLLTRPHSHLKFHLVVTLGDDSWCDYRSGHKAAGAFEVAAVSSFLRSARSNVFMMGELRTLVSRYGYPASRMSDVDVVKRVTRMIESGYLRVLECGGEPAEPELLSPTIKFGRDQVHVGSSKEEFKTCAGQHTHKALQGEETARHLERMLGSNPGAVKALAEAAAKATGKTDLARLPTRALIDSLKTAIAGGKLTLLVCTHEAMGGGGGSGQAAEALKAAAAAPPPKPSPKAAPPSAPIASETVLTWVSIEVVDEDGNLLEGENYEIRLSNGSTRSGKTGTFFADQIPEGECSIKLPNLHKNNWKPPGK